MAIIIQLPITVVIFLTSLFQVGYVQISLVIYGIVVYWYATKRIMPRILAETQRRKRTQKEIEIKSR
jgi:hypothetical protein